MSTRELSDTLTALEAYASVCRRNLIEATVDSIDGEHISQTYEAAGSTHPARLDQHIRKLKRNPFASQLLARAQASQAMAAIEMIVPSSDSL